MNEQPTAPLVLTPEIVEMQSHILSRLSLPSTTPPSSSMSRAS